MSGIEIHGHRGARGLFPENTINSFVQAIRMGVDAIELDVVISKDEKIVVSHEPWMNHLFCTKPNGLPVKKNELINLFQLNYAEIRKYDCGNRANKNFPKQKKKKDYKPLLVEAIQNCEAYTTKNNYKPINYNIEIKSQKNWETLFQPHSKIYAKLIYKTISNLNIFDRIILQSFDIRILKELYNLNKRLKLGLLVDDKNNFKENIKKMGFIPYAYNPHYKLLNKKLIKDAHALGIKVYTWTINSKSKIKKLIDMQIDGLITDYPDICVKKIFTLEKKSED